MNNTIIKSKRVAFKDLGIKSPITQGLSPEYYKRMKETRERWAKEDAEKDKI